MNFKKLNKSKIEWCDYTWNPVWGCKFNCSYCYARNIARRFCVRIAEKEYKYCLEYANKNNVNFLPYTPEMLSDYIKRFYPIYLYSNAEKEHPKKPSIIFVNSMSDISFWETKWMQSVVDIMNKNKQHVYIMLTKDPNGYRKHVKNGIEFPFHCWLGYTIDLMDHEFLDQFNKFDKNRYQLYEASFKNTFINIEPLIALNSNMLKNNFQGLISDITTMANWLIVGAMTPKNIHDIDQIKSIIHYKNINDNNISQVPLFFKDNFKRPEEKELIKKYRQYPDAMLKHLGRI